jgi:myo-inositol-1(or 4)-monophosphatase
VTPDLAALQTVALRAMDLAEAHVLTHRPRQVTSKGDRDMVTDVDLAVEHTVRDFLIRETPAIGVLGEEEGGPDTSTRWVLDPVDGTANFTRAIPLTGISLALVHDDRAVLGVVALPLLNQRFWAADGLGSWCNGRSIHAATTTRPDEAVVAVGDYGTGPGAEDRNRIALALHAHLAPRVQRIRMLGSAAVDLAWVASGALDTSITLGNRSWDMAAGTAIARNAGAVVIDVDGTAHTATSRFTIATTPGLRSHILSALQAAVRAHRPSHDPRRTRPVRRPGQRGPSC